MAARAELSWEAVQDVGGLVVCSAIPFLAVQALADSQAGKDLMARLEAQKPVLQREAEQRERERRAVRQKRCEGRGARCRGTTSSWPGCLEALLLLPYTPHGVYPAPLPPRPSACSALQPLVWR